MNDSEPRHHFEVARRDYGAVPESAEAEVRELGRDAVARITSRRAPWSDPAWEGAGDDLTLEEAAAALTWPVDDVRRAAEGFELLVREDPDGNVVVPAFQIAGSAIDEAVTSALRELRPVCVDPRTLLAWFLAPKDELSGASPAAWINQGHDSTRVILAAQRDAARLS